MTQVHTQYGLGEIVAEDVVRGRRQYKVAGAGFEVWMPQEQIRVAAADVDFDHSVALPYNPTPQHPAIPGATESTIQPNHSIDVDELLHPADSITFNDRTESEGGPWPKPNPALFAASLMRLGAEDDEDDEPSDSGDSDSAPPFGGGGEDSSSDDDSESDEDDGEEPSTPPDDFGPTRAKSDSDDSSPADDPGGESDTDDQGAADQIPEDYLEHPLIDLVQEAQMMLQEHPDWAQRPVGDIIDEQTGGPGEGGEEQGPPEQGGLPPELGGTSGLPAELGGGGPSPEELGAKLSMILGRAMCYSDPHRDVAMIRHAAALHEAGFEREAWAALPALALRALPLIQKAWPFIQKALPSLAGSFAGHQLAEGDGAGSGGGGVGLGGEEGVVQENLAQGQTGGTVPAASPADGGMSGMYGNPIAGGGFGSGRTGSNERLAWQKQVGQTGLSALQALVPLLTQTQKQKKQPNNGRPVGVTIDQHNPLPLWSLGGPGYGGLTSLNASIQRPAGLSDRYIEIESSADYHNDPIAQFRHDPSAFISRTGHVQDEGLNPRFAEYVALVEADRHIREAAWSDVRVKALRLRRDGQVHVNDIGPDRIHATVQGDHGIYDTMITKGASFVGLNGGYGIDNWHCGCEWGKWAFKRKYSYVGRLCSHGYAAYLEMQSQNTKDQPRAKRQTQPVKVRRRADALQMTPQRLVPELVINDTDDSGRYSHPETVDVTKDERTTTGPGGIVTDKEIKHFTSMLANCERTGAAYPRELVAYLVKRAVGSPEQEALNAQYDAQHPKITPQSRGGGGGGYRFDPAAALAQQSQDYRFDPMGAAGEFVGVGAPSKSPDPENPNNELYAPTLKGMGRAFNDTTGLGEFVGLDKPAYGDNGYAPTLRGMGQAAGDFLNDGLRVPGGSADALHTQHGQLPTPGKGQESAEAGAQAARRGESWNAFEPGGTGGGLGGAGMQANGKDWRPSTETTGISGDKYTVLPGDTGQNIADRAKVDVGTLKAPSGDINKINPGDVLDTSNKSAPDKAQSRSTVSPVTGNPLPTHNGVPINTDPMGGSKSTPAAATSSDPALKSLGTPGAVTEGVKVKGSRKLEAYFSQYYAKSPVRYAAAHPSGPRVLEAYFSRYYGRPITAAEEAEGEEPDPLVAGDQDGSPGTGKAGTDTLNPNAKPATPKPAAPAAPKTPAPVKTDAEKKKDEEEAAQDKQVDIGKTDPTNMLNQGPTGNNRDVGQAGAGGLGDIGGITNMIGDIGSAVAPAIGAGLSVIPELASGLGGALSGGLGGALSGLSGIFGHKLAAEEFGYPELQPHEPFAGSGPQPPLEIHPSSEHMEGIDYEDVTDLGSYDPYQRHEAARWFEADDNGTAQGTTSGQDTGGQGQGLRNPAANSFSPDPGVTPPAAGPAATPAAGTAQPSGTASGMAAPVPPISPGTQPLLQASLHYAEGIDTPADWEADDATDANAELEQLRNWAQDGQEEFFGDMDQHVQEIQDTVQQAHEHGVDASQLVASRGGIKRAGKPRQRPAVVPEVVRVYGGNGNGGVQTVAHVEDHDPYSKTASDFDADAPDMSGGGDIVAQFQRSAAAQDIMASSGGGDDFDISAAAMAHIKTAGRNFSIAEQHELMNEKHPKGARNLASLDLEGTHYEAENSTGLW